MIRQATRKMKTSIRLASLALTLSLTGPALAECQGSENLAVPAATPSEAFFDFGNGTVLHRPTQLIWTRCAIGQEWTGSGCSGEPELLDWAAALNAAAQAEISGQSDWRLPNRNELSSIVETRCHGPAINGTIFPDSPAAGFWTSSPVQTEPEAAWIVDLAAGALEAQPANQTRSLRLVRGGRM